MPEIQKVGIKHEAILDFLMCNPTMRMQDVAAKFGVSGPWLSCIVHSDAFQSMLRKKQDVAFHHSVLPIREKMQAVAGLALDRLLDTLPNEADTRNLSAVADNVLEKMGFSSKAPAVQVNNSQTININTSRSELEEARALLGRVEKPQLGVTIDGNATSLPIGIGQPQLSNPHPAYLGQADSEAPVHAPETEVGGG